MHACTKTVRFRGQVGRGHNCAHRCMNSHRRASERTISARRESPGNPAPQGPPSWSARCTKTALPSEARRRGGDRAKAAAATAGAWAALALIYRRMAASRPHGATRCARSACWAISRPQAVVGPLFASIKRNISIRRQGRAAGATWRRPAY